MRILAPILALLIVSVDLWGQAPPGQDVENLPFAPRRAICYRAAPLTIDGRLVEPGWRRTAWSEPFIDIRGDRQPRLSTRVKMLWDDEHFYIAADLEETDVWATLTERDSVIFQDNDFEVFIDPDGVRTVITSWKSMRSVPCGI